MRFMLLMKGDPPQMEPTEQAGQGWSAEFVARAVSAMRAWDDEMRKAGVLLASEGLVPSWSSKGVVFSGRGRRPRVVDGPFAEAKEVVAGFTIIDVSSEDEAIEWATRCPVDLFLQPGQEFLGVEVRRIGEIPQDASEAEATAAVLESIAR